MADIRVHTTDTGHVQITLPAALLDDVICAVAAAITATEDRDWTLDVLSDAEDQPTGTVRAALREVRDHLIDGAIEVPAVDAGLLSVLLSAHTPGALAKALQGGDGRG